MLSKMARNVVISFSAFILCFSNCFATNHNIDINLELLIAMKAYHVPVVGYAIIENNKIISANTLSTDAKIKVSTNSLFQAASISKSVSAYGALELVSQGKLNLDASVNKQLTTWKIPVNEWNQNYPVTLRQLLNMTSGLSISGFPGYFQNEQLPKLQEILDGKSPANTSPIRVFYQPGSQYFYSGGAFQVLEQLIEDTTKQLVSKSIAAQMLTRQKNTDYGLGFVVNGDAKTLNFRKAGHNTGYHNQLLMFPNSGNGVVIMTDSENGEYIINYIIPIIAKKYNWPCYFPFFDELVEIPKYAC